MVLKSCAIPDSEVTQIHHLAFGKKAGKLELGNGDLSPPMFNNGVLALEFQVLHKFKIIFSEAAGNLALLLHRNRVVPSRQCTQRLVRQQHTGYLP